MIKLTEMSWRAAQREMRCEGWSRSTAHPAGRLAVDAGGVGGNVRPRVLAAKRQRDARCASVPGSPRRGAERGRPLPSTQGGHLCAALPGCHRNEQRAVGGWGRRRVGKRGGGPARGGRELAPAVRALSPLEPELAGGDPEDTEPRALREAPAPPATTEQVAKQPFRPWPGPARAVRAHLSPAWCPAGLR